MAGIFAVFALSICAVFGNQRALALSLLAIGLVLSLLMLWYHATDMLQINL